MQWKKTPNTAIVDRFGTALSIVRMGDILGVCLLKEEYESFWHLGMADRSRLDRMRWGRGDAVGGRG
ncbi:MAG TPA: hypothetical protein VFZ61_04180, partial [Polyangiales bacterium]